VHPEKQTEPQPQRVKRGRGYGRQWPKGLSQNPSGKTNTQILVEDYTAEFVEMHGRQPRPSEKLDIRALAKVAARRATSRGLNDVAMSALGCEVSRTRERLGLDRKQEPAPSTPRVDLEAYLSRNGGDP
jgi:hypothetical protein